MLGKLIKHDWVSVWKTLLLINGGLLAVTLIGSVSFLSPLWTSDISYLNLLAGLILFGNILCLIIAAVATFIYIAVHYYKNLFSDEGYLMHTLPVKSWQLVASKLIVACIAQLISIIMICLCIFLLVMSAALQFSTPAEIGQFFSEFFEVFRLLAGELGVQFPLMIVYCILYCLGALVTGIMTVYGAISIGQMFQKHRVVFSVIFYFVIYSVYQAVMSIGLVVFAGAKITQIEQVSTTQTISPIDGVNVSLTSSTGSPVIIDFVWQTLWLGLGFMVLGSVVLFFLSKFMMTKKLNLE